MTLNVYQNNSDKNVVSKSITTKATLTGTLRENCSVIDPIITVEALSASDIPYINYAEIVEFGRYYYVNDIVCMGKLYELHMHIDVLMTYKDQIKPLPAIIARQESAYNLYLQDGLLKQYANPHIEIKQFPGAFTDFEFIFSVVG